MYEYAPKLQKTISFCGLRGNFLSSEFVPAKEQFTTDSIRGTYKMLPLVP